MEDKLKVGDKVVSVTRSLRNTAVYDFSEVVRLTNTRAILKNECVLVNKKDSYSKSFEEHGGKRRYHIATEEDFTEAARLKKMNDAHYWFVSQSFTDEQKIAIYELFNKNDKP